MPVEAEYSSEGVRWTPRHRDMKSSLFYVMAAGLLVLVLNAAAILTGMVGPTP